MADPLSTTSPRSSSTTPTPEVVGFSYPAQAPPDTPEITNNSTTTSASPTLIETLIDRQELFDSATNNWVPVPRGLILLPAVQDTNADTAARGNNPHAGARTHDDPFVERGNSSGGLHTEEEEEAPLATSLNEVGNPDQAANTGQQQVQYGAAGPSPTHAGTWFDFLHQARDALNRMESVLNAPFGYDSQGNLILFDPFADPSLPESWSLNLDDFELAPPVAVVQQQQQQQQQHNERMGNGYINGSPPHRNHNEWRTSAARSDPIGELPEVAEVDMSDEEDDEEDEEEEDEEEDEEDDEDEGHAEVWND
ncbi:hypothetical protein MMC29_005146 [Sticta canariensis]|nr:hypothetical protein [Sticta canariensis]